MIAQLRGKPVASTPEGLVLDVGGVGYLVAATPSAVRKAAGVDEVTIETYMVVREDALQLYGFATEEERELFLMLSEQSARLLGLADYGLAVGNGGLQGKGVSAEGVIVTLQIPADTQVVAATGTALGSLQQR